eukprot:scaffold15805_cov213-Isochrysis_galbana.AAC.1
MAAAALTSLSSRSAAPLRRARPPWPATRAPCLYAVPPRPARRRHPPPVGATGLLGRPATEPRSAPPVRGLRGQGRPPRRRRGQGAAGGRRRRRTRGKASR